MIKVKATQMALEAASPEQNAAEAGLAAVRKNAIKRAVSMLRSAGARFAVLEDDGTQHGDLEIVRTVPSTRRRYGTFSDYYKPLIENLMVGDSAFVPWGEFGDEDVRESFRGSISSYMVKLWGKGSFVTHANDHGIAVMRCEPSPDGE